MTTIDIPEDEVAIVRQEWIIWNATSGKPWFTTSHNHYGNDIRLFDSWDLAEAHRIRVTPDIWMDDVSEVRPYHHPG